MMREKRQSGGAITAQDDDEMELMAGTQVGDEIKKLMSLKANKAPSLS